MTLAWDDFGTWALLIATVFSMTLIVMKARNRTRVTHRAESIGADGLGATDMSWLSGHHSGSSDGGHHGFFDGGGDGGAGHH
jgi:hypothetical protein